MIRDFVTSLASVGRGSKRVIVISYDVTCLIVALVLAFVTRFSSLILPHDPLLFPIVLVCGAVGIMTLYFLGVYHTVTRYLDARQIVRLAVAAMGVGATWIVSLYMLQLPSVPRSIGVIWPAYLTLLWFGGRYAMAALMFDAANDGPKFRSEGKPVLIYGANAAGISLAEGMRAARHYRAICFVDDDPKIWGQRIAGLRIYGPSAIKQVIALHRISDACLALPNAPRRYRMAAFERLSGYGLNVKTIPDPNELLTGRFSVADVRPVQVNDLLHRDAVLPHRALIEAACQGRSVLITGAGGSIGSELCRQLLQERPTRLVLLDHSEFALFAVLQELVEARATLPAERRPDIIPVIGSILDAPLLSSVIKANKIDTVYHAAAYKHVPLLETNELVGVANNVLGTNTLVRVVTAHHLERFILISTDKAVRPANVMGSTKRAAELIVQAAADSPHNQTRFGIVRFGNVLDSSGSVVQLFRRQINEGRAVTVTDPGVTRFFMSIPEATQLVLQASAMADCGEVFVLDMGEPVLVYELATNMIRLSGLTVRDENNPEGDIPIEIIGLRPGEKLYEELFVGDRVEPTSHPRIRRAHEHRLSMEILNHRMEDVLSAIQKRDSGAARLALAALIAEDRAAAHVTA